MSNSSLPFRGLYGIAGPTSGSLSTRATETIALSRALLEGGVRVLQLRDKDSDGRALVEVARELRRMTSAAGALFIVNDRLDVALIVGADGVHVGQDDLPVEDVRKAVSRVGREKLIIGLSTHDLEQVREATKLNVDYVGFGPVFGTATKIDALPARGTTLLAEAVRVAGTLPVVAIGGISLATAAGVAATGAAMAAVIGDIAHATDPAVRAHAIHAALS